MKKLVTAKRKQRPACTECPSKKKVRYVQNGPRRKRLCIDCRQLGFPWAKPPKPKHKAKKPRPKRITKVKLVATRSRVLRAANEVRW